VRQVQTDLQEKVRQVQTDLQEKGRQVQTDLQEKVRQVQTDLQEKGRWVQTDLQEKVRWVQTDLQEKVRQVQTDLQENVRLINCVSLLTGPLSVDGHSSELEDEEEEEGGAGGGAEVTTSLLVPQTPDQEAFLKEHFVTLANLSGSGLDPHLHFTSNKSKGLGLVFKTFGLVLTVSRLVLVLDLC